MLTRLALRRLPTSPIPTLCCTALVKAYRSPNEGRLLAMSRVVHERFPEHNRLLVMRILRTMRALARRSKINLMTAPAIASCIAPLLLRPLMGNNREGEYEEMNMDAGRDVSAALIAAAMRAHLANSIVLVMIEEFEAIFVQAEQTRGKMEGEDIHVCVD